MKYGWIPDQPDARDRLFAAHPLRAAAPAELPDLVDLRQGMPPVYDQGQLSSCTANAVCAMCQAVELGDGRDVMPSRLFNYYFAREDDGILPDDGGASIRTAIKVVADMGLPAETFWPYIPSQQAVHPDAVSILSAAQNQALEYHRVATASLDEMRTCLALWKPFAFGIMLQSSFDSAEVARTGMVPIPEAGERELGGHAMLAVGYSQAARRFIVRNSWGAEWGHNGYCYIPYEMLTHSEWDAWTITVME